jgi:hypothetical protein
MNGIEEGRMRGHLISRPDGKPTLITNGSGTVQDEMHAGFKICRPFTENVEVGGALID